MLLNIIAFIINELVISEEITHVLTSSSLAPPMIVTVLTIRRVYGINRFVPPPFNGLLSGNIVHANAPGYEHFVQPHIGGGTSVGAAGVGATCFIF